MIEMENRLIIVEGQGQRRRGEWEVWVATKGQ